MNPNEVYEEKSQFVRSELSRMLNAATHGVVTGLSYTREGAIEYVTVDTPTVMFNVNVTADSLWAIAKDVTRAVDEHFM